MKLRIGVIIFFFLTVGIFSESLSTGPISLVPFLECHDPSNEFTIEDYSETNGSLDHYKLNTNILPIQWKQNILYCRANMGEEFQKARESVLTLANLHQDQVDILVEKKDGLKEKYSIGDRVVIPKDQPKEAYFQIQLSDIQNIYFVFKSQDGYQEWNDVQFWKNEEFTQHEISKSLDAYFVIGILIGVLIFLVFGSVFIFSKTWASLSLWCLSLFNLYLYHVRMYSSWGWIQTEFSNSFYLLSLSLSVYFFYLFAGQILKYSNVPLHLKKFFKVYSIVILIVNLNFGKIAIPTILFSILVLSSIVYVMVYCVKTWKEDRNPDLMIFLVGMSLIILPVSLNTFGKMGWIQNSESFHSICIFGFGSSLFLFVTRLTSKSNRETSFLLRAKEQKKHSETLTNQLKEIKIAISKAEKSKLINQLASQLIQEINNPLNYIATGNTIIQDQIQKLKYELMDILDDTNDSRSFNLELENIIYKIESSLSSTDQGLKIIRDTVKEIRDISGVNGVLINTFDIHKVLKNILEEFEEKKNLQASHIKIFVNGMPWKNSNIKMPLNVFSNQYIITRSFRTILSNAIHFAQKNPLGMVDIQTSILDTGTNKIFTIYFKNNGPPIESGKELEVLDVKSMRLHGGDFVGLPMIRELLKSMRGSLTLVDHGRESGWVNIQVHLMNFETTGVETIVSQKDSI